MNESRPPNQPPDPDPRDEPVDDGVKETPAAAEGDQKQDETSEPDPIAEDRGADGTRSADEAGVDREVGEGRTDESSSHDVSPTGADSTEGAAGSNGGEAPPARGARSGAAGNDDGKRKARSPVVALIALIALIAAGVLAAVAWHLHERLEVVETRLAEVPGERERVVEEAVDRVNVRGELDELAARLADETDTRAALADRMEGRTDELAAAIADVRELAVGHHTRWRLAEVRYLVSLGVRRLQLAEDPDGAATAFEAADEALHRLGDARLLDLRTMLVDDIARIRALEPADVEGIALRLRNLERAIERLPAAIEDPPAFEPLDPDAPFWEQIVDRLRGLVVVRHRDADAEPVAGLGDDVDGLSPRDALSLALRQARLAALNGDAARYERAVSAARDVLAEHFDGEARLVGEFRDRLERLADQPVRIDVPDLGPTLDKVAEVTARLEAERERARDAAAGGDE